MPFSSACLGLNFCWRASDSFCPSLLEMMASLMLTTPILVRPGVAGADEGAVAGAAAEAVVCAIAAAEIMAPSPRLSTRLRVVDLPNMGIGYSLNLFTAIY